MLCAEKIKKKSREKKRWGGEERVPIEFTFNGFQ